MKKTITLCALTLCLSMSINAQVRKTWDFRNGWGAITQSRLKSDATNWTNKCSTSNPVYFESKARSAGAITATVDGSVVELTETKGLKALSVSNAHLNLYSNSAGEGCLWFNGKKTEDAITIPSVGPGEIVTIDYESHKDSEARGFKSVTDGFVDVDDASKTSWTSTGRDTAYVINNNTTTCDYTIQATNGYHIYAIIVGAGDDPDAFKTKVGYVYSGDYTNEDIYKKLAENGDYLITPLDASTTLTEDQLKNYDVDVLSTSIAANNANIETIKNAFPFVPTLNLNADLYSAWGYGEKKEGLDSYVFLKEASNPLFNVRDVNIEYDEETPYVTIKDGAFAGVSLNEYFADDDTLAIGTDDDNSIAIHEHNISHNGYLYMAFPESNDNLLYNAIDVLAASKTEITQTATPTFDVHYGQQTATVTINSPEPYSQIYYTTDGSEPAIGTGTKYTEPFTLTTESTVKAIAQGQGYNVSEVNDTLVKMYDQAAAPVFGVSEGDDEATISLTCSTPNTQIWYCYSNDADSTAAIKYTAPFVINDHKVLYAFATSDEYVTSEVTKEEVFIKNDKVFIDELSHFDANSTNYSSNASNGTGIFSWGKNGQNQEDEENALLGDDGELIIPIVEPSVYPADTTGLNIDWVVKSQGQSVIWQNVNPGSDIGDSGAYNPATAADVDTLITKYDLQFYNMYSNQCNARIESKKLQGPFDVVSFIGTASGKKHCLAIEISTDGTNWTTLGDTVVVDVAQRLYNKVTRSYRGSDEVYVRLKQAEGGNSGAQIYDIYIMVEGEKSLALEAELAEAGKNYLPITGVTDVNVTSKTVTAVYNINGVKQNKLQNGLNIVKYSDGSVKKVIVK